MAPPPRGPSSRHAATPLFIPTGDRRRLPPFGGCFLFERGGCASPGDSHRQLLKSPCRWILRVYRNCTCA